MSTPTVHFKTKTKTKTKDKDKDKDKDKGKGKTPFIEEAPLSLTAENHAVRFLV